MNKIAKAWQFSFLYSGYVVYLTFYFVYQILDVEICTDQIFHFDYLHERKLFLFVLSTLREESSQTNGILQYKLLAAIFSAVYSVIQQS